MEINMNIKFTVEDYFKELQLMESQYGQEEELYPWVYMLLQMIESRKKEILKEDYNKLSLRLVAKATKADFTPERQLLGGIKQESGINLSFPDIAILNQNFNSKNSSLLNQLNYIHGCIECKKPNDNLPVLKSGEYNIIRNQKEKLTVKGKDNSNLSPYNNDLSQLLGELVWYSQTLLTNGLIWKYYKITNLTYSTNNKLQQLNFPLLREKLLSDKNFSFENLSVKIETKDIADLSSYYFNTAKVHTCFTSMTPFERLSTYAEWDRLIASLTSIYWQQEPTIK